MEILISDLDKFLYSLPEDHDLRAYINIGETREDTLLDFLNGDIDMQLAESLGCDIAWNETHIFIPNPGQDLSVLKELGNMDEKEFISAYDELTGFCDGGDDIDYAQGMPSILGDLISTYLMHSYLYPPKTQK